MKRFLVFVMAFVLAACGGHKQLHVDALALVDEGGAVLIDVRTPEEFNGGHLKGAINIPHTEIVAGLKQRNIGPDQSIVLYCRSGNRSGVAAAQLQGVGYKYITNAGAYSALQSAVPEYVKQSGRTNCRFC